MLWLKNLTLDECKTIDWNIPMAGTPDRFHFKGHTTKCLRGTGLFKGTLGHGTLMHVNWSADNARFRQKSLLPIRGHPREHNQPWKWSSLENGPAFNQPSQWNGPANGQRSRVRKNCMFFFQLWKSGSPFEYVFGIWLASSMASGQLKKFFQTWV